MYTEPPDRPEELLQGCNERGEPTAGVSRGACHAGTFTPHLAVHVIVERPDGRIVLQKRSPRKQVQPGKWDTSAGGHVLAGEDVFGAALRELQEELGIAGVTPSELYRYWWRSEIEREYAVSYYLRWAGPVYFPKLEIEEVRDWRYEEILAAPAALFTPNFHAEYRRFQQARKKR